MPSARPPRHTFDITRQGIHIYPRAESMAARIEAHPLGKTTAAPEPDFARTGIDGLEEMLSGGLDRGSSTIVVGPPGSRCSGPVAAWKRSGSRGRKSQTSS